MSVAWRGSAFLLLVLLGLGLICFLLSLSAPRLKPLFSALEKWQEEKSKQALLKLTEQAEIDAPPLEPHSESAAEEPEEDTQILESSPAEAEALENHASPEPTTEITEVLQEEANSKPEELVQEAEESAQAPEPTEESTDEPKASKESIEEPKVEEEIASAEAANEITEESVEPEITEELAVAEPEPKIEEEFIEPEPEPESEPEAFDENEKTEIIEKPQNSDEKAQTLPFDQESDQTEEIKRASSIQLDDELEEALEADTDLEGDEETPIFDPSSLDEIDLDPEETEKPSP